MIKRGLYGLAMGFFGSVAATAQPNNETGNAWLERCSANDLPCTIYISGLLEGMAVQAQLSQRPLELCVAAGMSRRQMTDIVMNYLQTNPGERHHRFPLLITVALAPHLKCN
jgi:hypothetical protein